MKSMTKTILAAVVVFIVPTVLYAQSSGSEQRLIGTWIDNENTTWIFNPNGTLSLSESGGESILVKYGIAGTKMILISDQEEVLTELFFSPDGRMVIIVTASDSYYTLIKKS